VTAKLKLTGCNPSHEKQEFLFQNLSESLQEEDGPGSDPVPVSNIITSN